MLTLIYVIAYGLSRYLISTSTAIGVILVFIGAILTGLANSIGSTGFEGAQGAAGIMPRLALQGAISAVLTPVVFGMMGWSKRIVGLRARGVRE
jgi:hypothetical protein